MRVRPMAVLGWTAGLFALGWFGLPLLAAGLRPDPLPAEPPSEMEAVAHREAGERLASFVPRLEGRAAALFERCAPGSGDEVRMHYHDTWFRNAFFVVITADAADARATWRTIRDDPTVRGFEIGEPQTVRVPAADWTALRASLQAPAYIGLVPEEDRIMIDGFQVAIETCLDGRYHVVIRDSPQGPAYDDFLGHARRIGKVAGEVHSLPVWLTGDEVEGKP